MLEALILKFVATWLLGLVALVAGRYVGGGDIRLPKGIGRVFLMYLQVWGLTFFGVIVFGFLGHTLHVKESFQSGFAESILPLVAGAYFARQLMHLEMQRIKKKPGVDF